MAPPDPYRSRAVLVGIADYAHADLAAMPAADAGAEHLARLLGDPSVWGLPREHVTVLGTGTTRERILTAVRDAALATEETLVVYFAGHGLRDPGERLHLALADADPDYPQIGTLPYRQLRDLVRQAGHRARHRVTVLDCCYSGIAGGMSGTAAIPTRDELATALDESGAGDAAGGGESGGGEDDYGDCVLTSAPPQSRSFVRPGAALPEFTGELVTTLEAGVAGAGPVITLETAWRTVRDRMRGRGSPEPQLFAQNNATEHIGFHNRAAAERAEPGTPPPAPEASPGPGSPAGFLDARDAAEGAARAVPDPYAALSCLADLAVVTVTADPAKARRLADEVVRGGRGTNEVPRRAFLLTKAAACLVTLDPPRARLLVEEAEDLVQGLPGPAERVRWLAHLAGALAATDRERATWLAEEAEEAARHVPDGAERSHALRTLSYSLALDDAPQWRQRLQGEAEDLLNDTNGHREFEEAARVLPEGAARADMVRAVIDQRRKVLELIKVARDLVDSGHHHQAVELLEEAERALPSRDVGDREEALTELTLALHACVGTATRTIPDRVISLTTRVRDIVYYAPGRASARMMANLARALARVAWNLAEADPRRAARLTRLAQTTMLSSSSRGWRPFDEDFARALTEVGKALAPFDAEQAAALAREAWGIARRLPDDWRPAREAVAALALAGRSLAPAAPGRAGELLGESESLAHHLPGGERERTLSDVSRAMSGAARSQAGTDPRWADVFAREAERVARGLPDEERGRLLSPIAEALIATGKALVDTEPGLAEDYARQAERLARQGAEKHHDGVLAEIVLLQAELVARRPAYADRAGRTARRITDPQRQGAALLELVKALVPADAERAERVARDMTDARCRSYAFTEIAGAYR